MDQASCPICGGENIESLSNHLLTHSKESLVQLVINQPLNRPTQDFVVEEAKYETLAIFNNPLFEEERNSSAISSADETGNNEFLGDEVNLKVQEDELDVKLHSDHESTQDSILGRDKELETMYHPFKPKNSHVTDLVSPAPCSSKNDDLNQALPIINFGVDVDLSESKANALMPDDWDSKSEGMGITAVEIDLPIDQKLFKEKESINERSVNFPEKVSSSVDGTSTAEVDLMTDEEIPPTGEISEYEESDGSSFLSEDSVRNVRTLGSFLIESKRGSPVEFGKKVRRKTKKVTDVAKKGTTSSSGHLYICYDCGDTQRFKSLFELMEHSVSVHQSSSKPTTSSENVPVEELKTEQPFNNVGCDESDEQQNLFRSPIVVKREVSDSIVPPIKPRMKKKYICIYCTVVHSLKADLDEHIRTEHSDRVKNDSFFECPICGKTFDKKENIRKHITIHMPKNFTCVTCSKSFTTKFKLTEHERVHTKEYPFRCTVCNKRHRTVPLLNQHMKSHLPGAVKTSNKKTEFCCKYCHKILRSKRSYLNHLKLHDGPVCFKCPFCSETFPRHSLWLRHVRIIHDSAYSADDSVECKICQKKLHMNSLRKHMRIHSDSKPYCCIVCHKTFRTKSNLTSHSWTHTNVEKPFKCILCPKSYLFKKTLDNHFMSHRRRTHHFVCNECGVKFTYKQNLKRHMEEHFADKRHKCKTCGKVFQRRYYLKEHERIHSGVRPFICTICGKSSATKSNHSTHLRIHDSRDAGTLEG